MLLKISGFAAAAASATYAYTVHKAVRQIDPQRMTRQQTVSDSLRNSRSVNKIVDPRGGSIVFDTRYISVPIPAHRRDISDQELLARFTKGFFGGAVLRPERTVLRKLRWELVHLSGMTVFSVLKNVTNRGNSNEFTKCLPGVEPRANSDVYPSTGINKDIWWIPSD
ncbi:uncharacterized protein N7469_000326 [Penicillium citrinum]|uniref:Uncharacterized protein n=1 Tax=Penicillium citrinum TaxID=5077 RepID=A0A9W9PCI1_PENCI|nr:uncharacterized protein N7469_000326 [Penicillium citrinum]KAJ5241999.1 hypothetical protein N7469_000326 [Penicillium citrinum]